MWSYYQYRNIGKSVRDEVDRKGFVSFEDRGREKKYQRRREEEDLEKGQTSEDAEQRSEEQSGSKQDQSDNGDGASNKSGGEKSSSDNVREEAETQNDESYTTGIKSFDDNKQSHNQLNIENGSGAKRSASSTRGEDDQKSKQSADEKSKQENDQDSTHEDPRFIVGTFGDDDPFDPRNWSLFARCKNIAILSLLIFVQAWAGAADSQANLAISKEFHVSQETENMATAMYLFGIGAGSLFVGPLSETVGRNPTYLGGTFIYMLFVLGSATVRNYGGQIVCRFFVGLFASATLAINGGSVRDQFRPVKRTFVFPVIAWANVAAPVIAPIVGGSIMAHPDLSWRWTEWVTLIISAFAFVVAFLFLPETHLPTLLSWKAKHLRDITGDDRYKTAESGNSFLSQLKSIASLPLKFWTTESVIAVFGSYLVLLYVLLFSFLPGFDYIFKQTYKLPPQHVGACFGAIAAGATTFTLLAPGFYGLARRKTEHVRKRPLSPEFRLWPAIVAAPLLPMSLFWLGWTNYQSISIWSGLGACFVFGGCITAIYVSTYEYIIDSYGEWSSIALASITVVRYLVSGGMVMAARPMYKNIGVHYSLTWLGCVAALLSPAPLVFWWIGGRLRNKSPYAKSEDER